MAQVSKKSRSGINLNDIVLKYENLNVTLTKGKDIVVVKVNEGCKIDIINKVCFVSNETNKAFAGTDFSNINRAVMGLNKPFSLEVQVKGSGFKVNIQPRKLIFSLGFSHLVNVDVDENITVVQDTTKKSTTKENILILVCTSKNYNLLTAFVNKLTKLRKYNPYKKTGVIQSGKYMINKKVSKGDK